MKLITNYKYWILNFIGWVFFAFFVLTIDKISYAENMETTRLYYLISEGFLCGFLGFILSFVILFYFEKYFNVGGFTKKDVIKLIVVFIAVQVVYHILLWPILNIPTNYFFGRSIGVSFYMKLTNEPHFATYFIVWMFVILSIKIYHHINTIKLRQAELQTSLKESQLNTLKGQINPHFMFNSLNNIRGLMLEDVGKARNMLTSLSETLRYSLTKNDATSIALEDELEMVENYVAISKIQFEDRLHFETHIDEASLTKLIPPMIIQMLVENAIKHGISNLKSGGKVTLTTKVNEGFLEIEVINSGRIEYNQNGTQLGLKNIEKRLELLYANRATFNLNEVDNQVIATIKIPVI